MQENNLNKEQKVRKQDSREDEELYEENHSTLGKILLCFWRFTYDFYFSNWIYALLVNSILFLVFLNLDSDIENKLSKLPFIVSGICLVGGIYYNARRGEQLQTIMYFLLACASGIVSSIWFYFHFYVHC